MGRDTREVGVQTGNLGGTEKGGDKSFSIEQPIRYNHAQRGRSFTGGMGRAGKSDGGGTFLRIG